MPEINLTQPEADALLAMEKHQLDDRPWLFPAVGGRICVPLISANRRERFNLDISRGRIDLARVKYQTRTREVVILARLDLGGAPHQNPDGHEIPCPHLHLYRENYADKWAVPAPLSDFPRILDLWETLQDFMRFCRVTKPPDIQRGLFV
jgi:hypothetical protein